MNHPLPAPAEARPLRRNGWQSLFQSRRRTAGLATLLVACVLATGWYRSFATYDSVVLKVSGVRLIVLSIGGRIRLGISDPLPEESWFTWKQGDRWIFDSPYPRADEMHAPEQGRWTWGGFRYQIGSFDEGLLRIRFRVVEFPDWAVVVPIGLVGYALLRRRRTIDISGESSGDRLSDNDLASRRALIFLVLMLSSAVALYKQSRNEFILTNLTPHAITVSNLSVSAKALPGDAYQPPGWDSIDTPQPLERTVAQDLTIPPLSTVRIQFQSHSRAQIFIQYADTWLHELNCPAWGNRIYLRFDETNFQSSSEKSALRRWSDWL